MKVDNLRSLFQEISSKILLHEKVLMGTSVLSLGALFSSYFFGEVAPHDICINLIYTSAYSSCVGHVAKYVNYFEVVFGILAFLIPLIFVFIEPIVRKRFFRFLKWYIPLATILAILGYYAKFCLMWSCSSMLSAALTIDLLVFIAFFLPIAWSPLSKHFLVMIILLPPLILFVAYAITILAEKVKNFPQEINQKSHNDSGQSCNELKSVRERDQCLFLNGFQCEKIVSSDIKQECSDMFQRNQAVEAVDIKGCDKIIGEVQRFVCRKLIQEELGRSRSH